MMPKRNDAIAAAEAELAGLQKRHSSLQARHDTAAAALDGAKASRRAILTGEDDPAPAKLAAADKLVREADDARMAAAEASDEIAALIETIATHIAGLFEVEQREAQAADMEVAATAAEAAVARIRKAAKEIGAARPALAEAIGPTRGALYAPPTSDPDCSWMTYLGTTWFDFSRNDTREIQPPISADEIASRIAGHILAPALPGCAITSQDEVAASQKPLGPTQVLCPVGEASGIQALLVDPMRKAAGAMRAAPALAA